MHLIQYLSKIPGLRIEIKYFALSQILQTLLTGTKIELFICLHAKCFSCLFSAYPLLLVRLALATDLGAVAQVGEPLFARLAVMVGAALHVVQHLPHAGSPAHSSFSISGHIEPKSRTA